MKFKTKTILKKDLPNEKPSQTNYNNPVSIEIQSQNYFNKSETNYNNSVPVQMEV